MSLMRNSMWFTLIWTMIFIIFYAYFFFTSSIVAFEDAFVETVKEKGYPSDFEEGSKWNLSYYLLWSLSWLPNTWFNHTRDWVLKFEEWVNNKKEENLLNGDSDKKIKKEKKNDESMDSVELM